MRKSIQLNSISFFTKGQKLILKEKLSYGDEISLFVAEKKNQYFQGSAVFNHRGWLLITKVCVRG
jgi:hypothetical protein